jgi:tRNA dimethylallyltransferase
VVSADSRQIYRGMDIGTGKATLTEQARVAHHLLDIRYPDEVLTLTEYQRMAYAAIDAIHGRGRIPLLVGGTVLYIRAVTAGLRIPEAPPDPVLRARLEQELEVQGLAGLVERLRTLDPASANTIDLRNPRRVLRALEIVLVTGRSKVELEGADPPPYRMLQLVLTRERTALYPRIDARVDQMIAEGLVAETERLLAAGYSPRLPAMTSLGYREITAYLNGELSLPAAIERIKLETHRFVRHQTTWLRKLPNLHWLDMEQTSFATVLDLFNAWVNDSS